jgi:hypothetical protein
MEKVWPGHLYYSVERYADLLLPFERPMMETALEALVVEVTP